MFYLKMHQTVIGSQAL